MTGEEPTPGEKPRRQSTRRESTGNGGKGGPPRVLNANFAVPGATGTLDPHHALAAGREYELRVDVGPPWKAGTSLVKGKKDFPTERLPPTDDGWTLQVVLISSHFTPETVSGEIFLPVRGGQSHPVKDGVRAAQPGPLALRVTAPKAGKNVPDEALGRLCLYYGSNLVQSALVGAGVRATDGERLERENSIDVDYVLSATLGDLGEFETRRVSVDGEEKELPVSLSIALNGAGAGGHSITLKGDPQSVPAWVPFDPQQWTLPVVRSTHV